MCDYTSFLIVCQIKDTHLIILALSYFPKGLLPKYLRRNNVSQSCSEWNDVGPLCYKHQN